MLFSRYKADFFTFPPPAPPPPPENLANYVSILMYELQRNAPSERRKSHFRGSRFQNFPREDPPTSARRSTKQLDLPLYFCTLLTGSADTRIAL
jgi:hypothetical protein